MSPLKSAVRRLAHNLVPRGRRRGRGPVIGPGLAGGVDVQRSRRDRGHGRGRRRGEHVIGRGGTGEEQARGRDAFQARILAVKTCLDDIQINGVVVEHSRERLAGQRYRRATVVGLAAGRNLRRQRRLVHRQRAARITDRGEAFSARGAVNDRPIALESVCDRIRRAGSRQVLRVEAVREIPGRIDRHCVRVTIHRDIHSARGYSEGRCRRNRARQGDGSRSISDRGGLRQAAQGVRGLDVDLVARRTASARWIAPEFVELAELGNVDVVRLDANQSESGLVDDVVNLVLDRIGVRLVALNWLKVVLLLLRSKLWALRSLM